jgi:uncharacterized protein (TIGR02246 family)
MKSSFRFLVGTVILAVGLTGGMAVDARSQVVGGDEKETAKPPARGVGGVKGMTATAERNRPEDRAAIAEVAKVFALAFKANDAKAISSLFAEDGEITDENGSLMRGRSAIENAYALLFAERPGSSIEIKPDGLRFLATDVALEEGRTIVTPGPGGVPSVRHYSVLYGRKGTQWQYVMVREELDKQITNHERLKNLDWLVGEWLDESSESLIHVTCDWSKDGNFLLREFTVHMQGKAVMTLSQRIGWDPASRQIKSWTFDSEGGFAESFWNQEGESWLIKTTGVLRDGQLASATHLLTRLNGMSGRMTAVDRTIGGRVVAIEPESVLVKKPPRPKSK